MASPGFETVRLGIENGIARLSLCRADALNAINSQLVREFNAALDIVEPDRSVKALIVAGEGRAFSVGADIDEFQRAIDEPDVLRRFLEELNALFFRLGMLDIPVIAAVNGLTRAGGFELLLACDIAVAAEDAKIGDVHTPFGAMPGGGATQRAQRVIGRQRALELILTGRWLSGREAADYGIVLRAVPAKDLSDFVEQLVNQLRDKSRECLAGVKRAVRLGADMSLKDGVDLEIDLLIDYVRSSPHLREGIKAYREGRLPSFS